MSRRHAIAVAVAIAAMVAALLPPLWIQTTGDDVVLEVAPVDPLSLFRGNYVDLTYDLDFEVDDTGRDRSWEWNEVVYVVFDDARPANGSGSTNRDQDSHRARPAFAAGPEDRATLFFHHSNSSSSPPSKVGASKPSCRVWSPSSRRPVAVKRSSTTSNRSKPNPVAGDSGLTPLVKMRDVQHGVADEEPRSS